MAAAGLSVYLWYSQKSRYNRRCGHAWAFAIVVVQIAGAAVALLRAFDLITLDLIGISAALAASATACLQAKDHATLAEAYSVTAHELAAIESRTDDPATEEDWASFVDDAESAISREHVLWRARRGRSPDRTPAQQLNRAMGRSANPMPGQCAISSAGTQRTDAWFRGPNV